jgi:anaphase-promoting complex subunit 1
MRYGKLGKDVTYGTHMATSMALGFLYMGGGQYSLRNDVESVAAILCSVFPRFPSSTQDNRAHLQALRHFWVLAIEKRSLLLKDADTLQVVKGPVHVKMKSTSNTAHETFHLTAPCLLPPLKDIDSISPYVPGYLSSTLSFSDLCQVQSLCQSNTIFIKQKVHVSLGAKVFDYNSCFLCLLLTSTR